MSYWIELFAAHEEIRKYYGNAGHDYYQKHLTTKNKVDELEHILERIANNQSY